MIIYLCQQTHWIRLISYDFIMNKHFQKIAVISFLYKNIILLVKFFYYIFGHKTLSVLIIECMRCEISTNFHFFFCWLKIVFAIRFSNRFPTFSQWCIRFVATIVKQTKIFIQKQKKCIKQPTVNEKKVGNLLVSTKFL